MRILLGNSKSIILLILAIILCSYTSYTTAQIRVLSHNEEVDYNGVLPRIWDSKTYDDGTMVVRIIRKNATSSINKYLCFYELFSLRIINLDGTVVEKDLNLGIQALNYCVFQTSNELFSEFLRYYPTTKNQLLITYYNATDINNPSTYVEWGMVMDLDGNVYSRSPIGLPFIDNNLRLPIPIARIQPNINVEKGFLRIIKNQNNNIDWQQFRIETNGTITRLTFGELVIYGETSVAVVSMNTVDEGYAIAFGNTTNSFNATNPLAPLSQLFILPIGYNQNPGLPLLLYQTPIPNIAFVTIFCNIAYVGVGQICTLTATTTQGGAPIGTAPTTQSQNFYIKINFLSSGSVSSFQVINRNLPVENGSNFWKVNSLNFGGYLLSNIATVGPNQFGIYGFLFDEYSENPVNWGFPEPEPIGTKGVYQILPNNTLLVSQLETSNSWQFQVIDLPKFDANRDKGYSNLNVESTFPSIQSTINSNIKNITINFYDPVDISNGRLSVYQVINNQPYLRQHITETSCTVSSDGRTINANILDSTFSSSNGNYYVTMDNSFVVDRAYKEPLLGIRDNIWTFNIVEQKKVPFAPSTNGLLRLTPQGTNYFDSLTSNQQNSFFNTLLNDISNAVPVPRSRLTSIERTQVDFSVNEKQYLISIGIKETRSDNEPSVAAIVSNLNTMVLNKDQTPINDGLASQYLDATYGFNPAPNLWEKYKYRLLGVFLIVGLLIVLFLFAQRRDSNGNNIAVLQLGLIIFDLVLDIAFVSSNAKDVPILYIPSVLFVTLPIGINTILAFYIITQENTRPKFYQWFTAHGKVASVFTVLSGADIEALNILHSNLAGFPFFRAPFSDDAKSKIFWGACLNIFTEDIPQVVVQILYRELTVSYDNLIPLLTLISSCVNLTINIIGRLYQATNRLRSNHSNVSNDDDTDDFGGLVPASSDTSSAKKDLEKLEEGLDGVLNKSFNASNGNLGNDLNKNQNKGMTFLRRMVSRKE
ncbi:hypothetical protein GLOIN_2v1639405 [Rhizophagus clarus]|uniref:Uncharacterized protein n=1 Tax=Rhizophagus clarus TaxID=94130 RepID=A0A8H3KVU5_9GLOM|nr:hypothetical protein GLOIN_2v1639405 [Rhizophagus clarus]